MPIVRLQEGSTGLPPEIEVTRDNKIGGQAAVHFTTDGRYAVKIYHTPPTDVLPLLGRVMNLFGSLPAEQRDVILPPLALIESVDGIARVGFVMRRVPKNFRELQELMLNPVQAAVEFRRGMHWGKFLAVARQVANAVAVLHGKGCAHSDIHFRNFMADLDKGDAVMLEIDGVVVTGFLSPQVRGMMGFIAPEVLARKLEPSERTDRHSLAVLLLHTLLFRNVMQPLLEYDGDVARSEEMGWGECAVFSEHPSDARNRNRRLGVPLYRDGVLSYRLLTPELQKLAERALVDGLRDPDKRPTAREWEAGLANALDELWPCQNCRQYQPYAHWLQPRGRRRCAFCGESFAMPFPAVMTLYDERAQGTYLPSGRNVVLGDGFKVFADQTLAWGKAPLHRRRESIGHVDVDRRDSSYVLVNDTGSSTWTARSPDGQRMFKARKGESVPLQQGLCIHFGEKRLGYVVEDGLP